MTGNGLSAGDVLALSRDNDGFFGDGIWGIIMLLIIAGLFSGNGFGWGNRNNGLTEEYIANQFTQRDLYNNNTNILDTKYSLGTEIMENRFNCSQNACNTQKEILQSRYDNALGNQTILANQAQCCCDLKTAIHAEGEATRNMIQEDKIQQLRDQVYTTNLSLNNANLANQIITSLQPKTPIPAYLTCSPYFAYNMNGYGSCGCGNSTII